MGASQDSSRKTVFTRGVSVLKEAGIENPALDAAVLLGYVTNEPTETVLMDRESALAPSEVSLYKTLVRKRCERAAVSRLVGEREFYSRKFCITDDVLDPRPETERLVESAIRRLKELKKIPAVLDIGTGSGAIAITIALEVASARVTATDISMAALAVARRNARRHSVTGRLGFVQADLLDGVRGRFDAILSNPPYVSCAQFDDLPQEVRKGDPTVALVSGPDGTEFYEPLVKGSMDLLLPGGSLMVEMGDGQSPIVTDLFRGAGFTDVQIVDDLTGAGRVVTGKRTDA